ncbi:MAG: Lrp/AsnC family transcriptional regulator [Gammaproteobacteria bacterium]
MLLDQTDRKILEILQNDATLPASDIADRVGLSQSPCWRRINRLEKKGIIKRRVALLDRRALGLNVVVFAHIKLSVHGRKALPEFENAIRNFPEVLDCFTTTGEVDYILKVVTKDIESYERFFRNSLSQLPSVLEVNSTIALSNIKTTTELPLGLVD